MSTLKQQDTGISRMEWKHGARVLVRPENATTRYPGTLVCESNPKEKSLIHPLDMSWIVQLDNGNYGGYTVAQMRLLQGVIKIMDVWIVQYTRGKTQETTVFDTQKAALKGMAILLNTWLGTKREEALEQSIRKALDAGYIDEAIKLWTDYQKTQNKWETLTMQHKKVRTFTNPLGI